MRSQYFNLYYKYESWGTVVASEEHTQMTLKFTRTIDCWLTAGQIMDLYKDASVKDAIIEKGVSPGTHGDHTRRSRRARLLSSTSAASKVRR